MPVLVPEMWFQVVATRCPVMQIRKTIKTRGHFPNDEAATRLIWLSIMRAKTSWRSCYNWTRAMAVFRIHFEDRIPA